MRLLILLSSLVFFIALAPPAIPGAEVDIRTLAEQEGLPEFNRAVLLLSAEYPTDGTHAYWWPRAGESSYDGVSEDIYFNGQLILKGEPERRTFCCGLTLEVFAKAYQAYLNHTGTESKIPDDQWGRFRQIWFVREINGPGPSEALEEYGLGREIPMEEALPGDFVQIWRRWDKEKVKNGSGHSVIFLDWVRDDSGTITGMHYFSTQKSTNGVGINTEYFGDENATDGMAKEFTTYGRVELGG